MIYKTIKIIRGAGTYRFRGYFILISCNYSPRLFLIASILAVAPSMQRS